jgi:nickel/cobalt transporter (NicO) family protein
MAAQRNAHVLQRSGLRCSRGHRLDHHKQADFYRQFSGLIRAAKADGSAVWTLLGVSFLYGIFHAAGPGQGKAVISSYLIATGETWWRGIVLSFASALLQAVVAVAFVGIAATMLNATYATMRTAIWYIEAASYAFIALPDQ